MPRRGGGIGACVGELSCFRKVTIPQSALSRSQLFGPGPLCRCATSPHAVGSHPLHKGGFAVDRRGEQCSPAAISGNVRFHGSIWNAPLREPKRPPCVKGAGCAAAQTEGLRPYGYNPTRPYTLQSLRHGLRRATRLRVGSLCRCATSPHTVGSPPLHKGGFAGRCKHRPLHAIGWLL